MTTAHTAAFGSLLKRHRLAACLTQEALAERSGLSIRAISDLERGVKQSPHYDTLDLLARALALPAEERAAFKAAARGAVPPLPTSKHPLVAPTPHRTNLPIARTSFVGREREQAEIASLLETAPLVTLTGSGGAGKTRLASAVAAALLPHYPDGVWLIELAPLADPTLVPRAVATALALQEDADRPLLATIGEHLQSRRLLLLLDNCEHLLTASADLLTTLLRDCSQLRLLATSRESLEIAGETTYRVPSLAVPDPDQLPQLTDLAACDAVRLFLDRARARRPGFALTAANAHAIAQICQRLDGIPLAIELAAARISALPVDGIATRLDDCFRLLTGGPRSAQPRHQTLQATLDWSYDLLSDPERVLLRRLSVFAGGWTLDAAELVCAGQQITTGQILDLLAGLVNRSLAQMAEHDGTARYHLLETVRQYSHELLVAAGEGTLLRQQHLHWCLNLAEQSEPGLAGADQARCLARLADEHDNLRAALAYSLRDGADPVAGLQLTGLLWRYWLMHGHLTEGRSWLDEALARARTAPETQRARALYGAGILAAYQGDNRHAAALFSDSLTLARRLGDSWGIAAALDHLATAADLQGDRDRARTLCQESLALRRQIDDVEGIADSLFSLGWFAHEQCDREQARACYEESLALRRELGDIWSIAQALGALGLVSHEQGDYRQAVALYEEALVLREQLGDRQGRAFSLTNLGLAAREQGDYSRAAALLQESLTLQRELGDTQGSAYSLNHLGTVARNQGDFAQAAGLYQQSLALFREHAHGRGIASVLHNLGEVARFLGDYRQARILQAESLALQRQRNDTLGSARALAGLGQLAYADGAYDQALTLHQESLSLLQARGIAPTIGAAIEALALVAAAQGHAVRATQLFAAATALREAIGAPVPPSDRPSYDHALAKLRLALGPASFAAAWSTGAALPLDHAAAIALSAPRTPSSLSAGPTVPVAASPH